ncbi:MAG TPA: Gfo/Idh/MocA family oxidoreductase [Kiritimatiellia bacterium]|mgnify:CR=1 FL=1|jgi:predicted dehydrogenase|nr:Gfo/Idh/MocA family oxidoreductase [Kiritimatiellia bacterium]OQC59319.1 MAG: putative oxidoreductase YceM [Verrucomicrobia bacterium ADurb.Bin018]MBP9572837.1 Gfo/Idh/MocA family oxidoreductase [Kiritimatiellia bacterium]HOE00652.1 Gfo/Idh/MocA family oxidoreductase [Kiritimatiellia bacterium]HOE36265.1 Gfo/Idh/MocA family oxidoreductase [Kiritimatiellia bacterium]
MSTQPTKIKTGVIGVGSLGQWHARIYSEMPDVELVGVYDADRKRAQEIAERYHTRAFASIAELTAAADALNVVVPTDKHREVAGQIIAQGRHVLVEKPIAASTAEAEELVALAQEHNVILQVGHVERFNPVLTAINPAKQKAHYIEALRIAPYPPPRFGLLPRGTEVSVILDLMIHDLEIILHLVQSKVVDIRAVGVPVLSKSEDIANVRLRFENGCIANVTASRISTEKQRKIRVFLDDSYVSLDYQEQTGKILRKKLLGISQEQIPIHKGEPLALELRSFVDCIRSRANPLVSGAHGAEALKLAVAICQSIRQGPT